MRIQLPQDRVDKSDPGVGPHDTRGQVGPWSMAVCRARFTDPRVT